MLLKLEDVSLEFNDKIIFEKINLIFNRGDKIGIVGDNGIGKTSIFNIILNKIDFSGKVLFDIKNFGILLQDEGFIELKLLQTRKLEIEKLLIDEKKGVDKIGIGSRVENERAIHLYKKLGFRIVGYNFGQELKN